MGGYTQGGCILKPEIIYPWNGILILLVGRKSVNNL